MKAVPITDFEIINSEEALNHLLLGYPLLDVRAEVEFLRSNAPGTINLPILTTSERQLVGTTYKQQGQDAAVKLGHELVSGTIKSERVNGWLEAIRSKEIPALLCARGGMRSAISAGWLKESGTEIPRVRGGYKALRALLMEKMSYHVTNSNFILLDGRTGVGKTHLLSEISSTYPTINLEGAANHRGSAFGWREKPQPGQATFENDIVMQLEKATKKSSAPVLVEAESIWIGRCFIPKQLHDKMRNSTTVVLEASIESRVENILADYVIEPLNSVGKEKLGQSILRSLSGIQRRFSKVKVEACRALVHKAFDESSNEKSLQLHRIWIAYLLTEYYDPLYDKLLAKKSKTTVYVGNSSELKNYLASRPV